jgi:LmbE family N-acetylglucosaminyl deacetylase/CheY-like chemotaxis protein
MNVRSARDRFVRGAPDLHVSEAGGNSTASILLVEADDSLDEATARMLEAVGTVSRVGSPEEAIDVLGSQDWALVISDIEYRGLSGLDFVWAVRQAHPAVATLILTRHANFDYAVEAIRAGADDFLVGPLDPSALVQKVTQLAALGMERRSRERHTVLAIGAHPDDVEMGCGGILLRHAARGDAVTVLTLTGGEQGGMPAVRATEAARAAELMSARLYLRQFEDTQVKEGGPTVVAIERVVDEIAPTIVYTHTRHDVHQDHRNVHHASLVAVRRVPQVYCYQSPSSTVDFRPNRFVAIDDFLTRKLEVLEAYTSQIPVRGYLDEEVLRATARYWSRYASARYVEPLEVVRESDSLPAPPPAASGVVAHRRTANAV